MNQAEIPA